MPLNFFPPSTEVSEVRDDNNNILWEKPVSRTTTKGTTAAFRNTRMAVNLLNRPNGTYTSESTGSVTVLHNITTANVQFGSAWSIYKLTGNVNNTNIAVSLSDMKAKSTDAVLFKNGHTYIVKLFDSANDYYDLQIANTTTNMTITDGVSFTPTEDFNALWTRMNADGRGSQTGNKTFKVMIVEGTTAPDDYYPYFADTTVLSSAKAFGKSPVQNSANRPIGKTTKAIGPVPFSIVEAYEEYKKSIAYGETPIHKVGVYPYGKAVGTAPQTSESVLAGKYKTAQFMGKTITKVKKPVLWSQFLPVDGITNANNTSIDTGIYAQDNIEMFVRVKAITGSLYMLQARQTGTATIYGISGSQTNNTIICFGVTSGITRTAGDIYTIKVTYVNGSVTLYVKDETTGQEDTKTDTTTEYTFPSPTTIKLFGDASMVASGVTVYRAYIKVNGQMAWDMYPCVDVNNSNAPVAYDDVTHAASTIKSGSITAGDEIKPVSYLESTGTQYIDTGVVGTTTSGLQVYVDAQGTDGLSGSNVLISGDSSADAGCWFGHNTQYWTAGTGALSNVDYSTRIQTTVSFGTQVEYTLNGLIYTRTGNISGSGSAVLFKGVSTGSYKCCAKLFSAKIWNNSILVRDFIPAKIGSEYCLLDKISFQIYRNQGTGAFSGGPEIPYSTIVPDELDSNVGPIKYGYADLDVNIPLEYQRVEYIQSSGTQWIDTGVKFEYGEKVETKINSRNYATTTNNVYGTRNGSSSDRAYLMLHQGKFNFAYGADTTVGDDITANTDYTLKVTTDNSYNCKLYINDVLASEKIVSGITSTYNYWLFTGNQSGSSQYPSSIKMYFWRKTSSDGTTLVRDFIPVKKVSNNEYGMYDLVEGKFYANSGTGAAFTGGNVINREIYTTGTQEMSIKSKNLFDGTITNFSWNGPTSAIISNPNYKSIVYPASTGDTFTVSRNVTGKVFGIYFTKEYPSAGVAVYDRQSGSSYTTRTATAVENGIRYVVATLTETGDDISDWEIMLVKGADAPTTYSPYFAPQTYSNKNLLLSATSYLDFASREIYKDWAIKVLDGTENWMVGSFNAKAAIYVTIANALPGAPRNVGTPYNTNFPEIDTHFIRSECTSAAGAFKQNVQGATAIGGEYFAVIWDNNDSAAVTSFKAWLAEQLANGTPVIIIYPLATPTTTTDATLPEFTQNAGTSIIDNTDAYGVKQGVSVTGVNINVTTPAPDKPLPLNTNAGELYYQVTPTDTTKYPATLSGCERKVLDGTEDWQKNLSVDGLYHLNFTGVLNNTGLCTHYKWGGTNAGSMADKTFACVGRAGNSGLSIHDTQFGTTEALKAWLADVKPTVLYPLATSDDSVWTAASNTQGDIGYLCTTQGTATTSAPLGTFVPAKGMTVASVNGVITDGEQKFEIKGKNLLDINDKVSGEVNASTGGITTNANYYTGNYIDISNLTDFTISLTTNITGGAGRNIAYYDANKTFISGVVNAVTTTSPTTRTKTFTKPNNAAYMRFCWLHDWQDKPINDTDIQLEEGSTATTYEPYVTPYIQSIKTPLLSTNCYRDFSRKIDHNELAIKVLDGTENWSVATTDVLQADILTSNAYGETCISSHLAYTTSSTFSNMPDNSFKNGSSVYTTRLYVKSSTVATDATTWKTYLASEYAAGRPVIVIYPLATPTETPITVTSPTQNAGTNTADTVFADTTHGNVEMDGIMQLQTVPIPSSPLDIETSSGTLNWNSTTQELETDGEQKLILGSQGCIELGALTWSKYSDVANNIYYTTGVSDKSFGSAVAVLDGYSQFTGAVRDMTDKTITGASTSKAIYICDNRYLTAAEFKAAMSGKYLYYQRNTDETFIAPKVVDIKTILLSADDYEDVNAKLAHNAWAAKVLDGTENWSRYVYAERYSFRLNITDAITTGGSGRPVYCTHFKYKYAAYTESETGIMCFDVDSSTLLYFRADFSDVNDWKAWLASQYAKGDPVIVVYPLATATDTAVSTTPIALDKKANWIATNTTELGAGDVQLTYLGK